MTTPAPLENPDKFAMLADSLPHMVWVTDTHGQAVYFSQRWTDYTGCSLPMKKRWEDVLHPEDYDKARDAWQACVAEGQPYTFEYRLRRVDGVYRWHLARSALMTDACGQPQAWVGTCTDIQAQKDATLQQAQMHRQAQNDLLSKMALEIRTPLHGIMGIADVLLESRLDDQQLKLTKTIKHSGDSLMNLLNDMSDLSKVDSGRLALAKVPFDILTFVQDQADALSFRAIGKHLSLMTYVDPEIPDHLLGDPGRLSQVLLTLITYAIRFTNTGLVGVRATLESRQDDAARIRFSVEDTGIGMDPTAQAHLFEPFRESKAPASHHFSGTGLALTLAKRLVELMGGDMNVSSESNRGTTIFFSVPLQVASPSDTAGEPLSLAGKRVMVVDDDASIARVFGCFLQEAGARVTHRTLGAEALHQLRRVPRDFDVAVIDKRLSDIDGIALAREISDDPALAHLRLVMVSAHVSEMLPGLVVDAGLHVFLPKPVRKTDLIAAVAGGSDATASRRAAGARMHGREKQKPGATASLATAPGSK